MATLPMTLRDRVGHLCYLKPFKFHTAEKKAHVSQKSQVTYHNQACSHIRCKTGSESKTVQEPWLLQTTSRK